MRAARAIWRFLSHPVLSTLGNITLLVAAIPIGIAVLTAVVGWIFDQPTLFLVAIGLAALGIALVVFVAVRQRPEGSLTPSAVRAQSDETRLRPAALNGRAYGSAAIRQAISEDSPQPDGEMRAIQLSREMLVERPAQKKCDLVIAEFVAMVDEGDKLKGNAFGGEAAPSDEVFAWREGVVTFVGFALGDLERQRLLEVEPTSPDIEGTVDAILVWLRQRRDDPASWEARVRELNGPELDAAIEARRGQQPETLTDLLDTMIREGMELVTELSAPVEPEKTANGWKVEGGGPSAEQQENANAFRQRAGELIEQRNPALLADYRDGCNDYIRRASEDGRASDPSTDKRSDAEKMLALASAERRTAAWEVEVCLEGLAWARKAI